MSRNTTNDTDEFRERWIQHVDDYSALKSALHPDDWDELEDVQDQMKDIIETAAQNFEEDE